MARKSKTSKKLSKKLDKLEKEGQKLRSKAEKKGKELSSMASDRIDDLRSDPEPEKGGKGKFLLVLLGAVGAFVALKRKRDQELDEALWEEPRSI
ncbi:MAG: hypothetical protein WEB03_07910 [Nitriliruptor sp.]|uniref:hypothetical protein n=1 Tax=Nitriliruptor sp. TaxID=2448056 RepID=UPI00349FED53